MAFYKYYINIAQNTTGISLDNGTLMQIWKPANIFVFICKKYVEDFTLNTFYYLRNARVKYVKSLFTNIQKQ